MDQLVDLREELDLADAAAPALQVVSRAERLTLRMVVPDTPRDPPYLADRAEIERAPPYERLDRPHEPFAQASVARRGARLDEGRALPRQRQRFVIADRRVDRQRDRGHLGRGPQPEIDAQHIPVAVARLEQLDHPPRDPHRRLARLLAGAARERVRIEQEHRIDVGRIVELTRPLLAERDRDEADRLGSRRPLGDRGPDRQIERMVGEISQRGGDGGQVVRPGQVGEGDQQRQPATREAQSPRRGRILIGLGEDRHRPAGDHVVDGRGIAFDQVGQEGRTGPRARDRPFDVRATRRVPDGCETRIFIRIRIFADTIRVARRS